MAKRNKSKQVKSFFDDFTLETLIKLSFKDWKYIIGFVLFISATGVFIYTAYKGNSEPTHSSSDSIRIKTTDQVIIQSISTKIDSSQSINSVNSIGDSNKIIIK